ncbi:ABC transporter permease [Streptomyces sp. ST2-7A]|uniref:ABC transporter permease n=1 Tax=Streptomyces sp. ST2-7A TaxID=2907214 RepID=UPI001F1D3EA4|nr:ABC transporter permease [Streptomyces sp. ST2-7A]MCE7080351.1 ABC transporter permease [Streptomyces sp. ST2-7A]
MRLLSRRPRPQGLPSGVEPSRFTVRDLLGEGVTGMLRRPGRSALTVLGTVLGVGSFVAVLGLTATTSHQVDSRFDLLAATSVVVEDRAAEHDPYAGPALPQEAEERVARVNGVTRTGVFWPVRTPHGTSVRSSPVGPAANGEEVPVVAASPALLGAAEPVLAHGRVFDAFHAENSLKVAVLGSSVAARLGITGLETGPTVFIGDEAFTVIGVVEDVRRQPDLLLSVLVPHTTAEMLWGPPEGLTARMLITTRVGAAQQVAREAATALRPDHPEYLNVVPPPEPKMLRSVVTSDLHQLFLLLAAICMVVGAVGIANTTLVAVLERTGEIGVRRAVGARARHIALQFLAESGILGGMGGVIGTSFGTLTVVAVAVVRDWTPVVPTPMLFTAPVLGVVIGIVAGLYPAWRASRIQPAEALRR